VSVARGELPPDVCLTDAAGGTLRLAELRGQTVLLVFVRHLT
jgi:peroxiredoxin